MGGVIRGYRQNNFLGNLAKYSVLAVTYFVVLMYTEEEANNLQTVVSMLSCGALEKSNNPYIESIVETYVSQNQKEILVIWVWLGRKSWKRSVAMEKGVYELQADIFYLSVCEREKKTALELL